MSELTLTTSYLEENLATVEELDEMARAQADALLEQLDPTSVSPETTAFEALAKTVDARADNETRITLGGGGATTYTMPEGDPPKFDV